MGIFDWLFGSKGKIDRGSALPQFPWDRSPSIYEYLRTHIRPDAPGLAEGGQTLPDEEQLESKSDFLWAAGAQDGVLTHHIGSGPEQGNVVTLLNRVRAYWNSPTATNKAAVYEFVMDHGTVSVVDPFVEQLTQQDNVNHDRLYELARSFATEAPDREPVKFGIAILGLYSQAQDAEVLRTLGYHDEFTLFSAVALANAAEDVEWELWELAKNVDGWGRIQIVERLAGTENAEIKEWMLREGYRNSVLYEYLAYTCATAGGLLSALEQESVDDELLTSSGEIIQALVNGGPAESIDDYADGAMVAQVFVEHVCRQGGNLPQLLAVGAINGFLSDETADWSGREARGWSLNRRSAIRTQCEKIISEPAWRNRVLAGLRSSDELVFYRADEAARLLDIDPWEFYWKRLEADPAESGRWFHVMEACNDERIGDVLGFARVRIPIDEIASGPANELGLGPEWQPHSCLDFILQGLGRFPGQGGQFVEAGLCSPVTRNRNMALRTLAEWGSEHWPDSMGPVLQQALADEPDVTVEERIRKVIAGETLE